MELKEAVKKRQAVRNYEDKPVPEEKLLKVLEAARLAPSASNRQPWKFIVVREGKRRQELARAAGGQTHVAKAPVVITAVATMPEYVIWIGAFSQEEARDILNVPENCRIVTLLPLGFPKQEGRPKIRKSLDEIVCYETFKE